MKIIKKLFICILTLVISINMIPNIKAAENMYTINKEANNLDSNYKSSVSLLLNKNLDDKDKIIDIELVVDASTLFQRSGFSVSMTDFGNLYVDEIYELIEDLKAIDDLTINLGIVGFTGNIKELMTLTNVDDITSKSYISNKLSPYSNLDMLMNAYGSNLHGGLLKAKDILDNSNTGSDPYERYIITLTDGGNYTYNNANNETATTVYKINDSEYRSIGNGDSGGDFGSADRESKMVTYYNETHDYEAAFSKLMEEYDDIKAHADAGYKWYRPIMGSNMNYGNSDVTNIQNLVNEGSLTVYESDTEINDINLYPYTNLETGTIMSAKVLEDMADSKYNVYTIGYLYQYGFNNEGELTSNLFGLPSRGFLEYTDNIGTLYMENETSMSSDALAAVFDEITETVEENVCKKPYIIDEIGSGTYTDGSSYKFNFINDIDEFDLIENDTTLDKTKISDNKYGFGLVDGNYKYILTYDETNESIRIDINFNMPKDTNVVFNYNIELDSSTIKDKGGVYGEYDKTGINELTSLKSSNMTRLYTPSGDNLDYSIPTLSYEIIRYKAEVIKHENSAITLSKENELKENDEVVITIVCDSGYEFNTLSVVDTDNTNINYTKTNDNYKFNMPANDVKVSGVCTKIEEPEEEVTPDIPEEKEEETPITGDNIIYSYIMLLISITNLLLITYIYKKKLVK